ncbi:MAG: hypothetical protein K2W95_25435 [Candidatus Obscuribacterales bacterium]|nr:hypothetical protein [Candidatus Obscuribacterales bacterium]
MFTFFSCLIAAVLCCGTSYLLSRWFYHNAGNRPKTYFEARATAIAMCSGSLLAVIASMLIEHFATYPSGTLIPAMIAGIVSGLAGGYFGMFRSGS